MGITLRDCEMALFVYLNGAVFYDDWPKEYQNGAAMERLKRLGYVRRKYDPLRYGLSRSGHNLIIWLTATLEHRNSISAAGA